MSTNFIIENSHGQENYDSELQENDEVTDEAWLSSAANNPAFDFLNDAEEDIYTISDGEPFCA